jgi:hypothetical protein
MAVLPFLAGLAALTGCTATDGDSLNCNGERVAKDCGLAGRAPPGRLALPAPNPRPL